jgi:hypothetical protein
MKNAALTALSKETRLDIRVAQFDTEAEERRAGIRITNEDLQLRTHLGSLLFHVLTKTSSHISASCLYTCSLKKKSHVPCNLNGRVAYPASRSWLSDGNTRDQRGQNRDGNSREERQHGFGGGRFERASWQSVGREEEGWTRAIKKV